jgi:N utilization substance protein A
VGIRDYETREMEVIVAEDQLSLAIGKRGQNVRLAGKLVGWSLDIKSEAEKKAEVEAEMERMEAASRELASLPGIDPGISNRLLEAGFRTVEEVSLASMDDLTGIEGVDEESAIAIHDAAEVAFEVLVAQAEQEALEAAEAEAAEAELAEEEGEEAEAVEETEALESSVQDDAVDATAETETTTDTGTEEQLTAAAADAQDPSVEVQAVLDENQEEEEEETERSDDNEEEQK